MLSDEKHCGIVSDHVRDKAAAMYDSFKLFAQLFSGLVGGAVIVRLQYGGSISLDSILLSNVVAALIAVTCATLLLDAYRSWFGFRNRLSELAGRAADGSLIVPYPSHRLSARSLAIMLIVMAVALLVFIVFNPLGRASTL